VNRWSIHPVVVRHKVRFTAAFLLLAVFGILALFQATGVSQSFDEATLRMLRESDASRPIASGWLLPLLLTITWFGDFPALLFIASAAAGAMLLLGHRRNALALTGSSMSGVILMLVLKDAFGRPRPDVVPALAEVSSLSFPSGHALMSVAVYIPIIILLIKLHPQQSKLIGVSFLLFLLLISFSRMYLGVHYPSDIIAGWAVGAVCVVTWSYGTLKTGPDHSG
jgi:undecaprenyl-diphosphatase